MAIERKILYHIAWPRLELKLHKTIFLTKISFFKIEKAKGSFGGLSLIGLEGRLGGAES